MSVHGIHRLTIEMTDRHPTLKQLRIAPRSHYNSSKTCLSGTRTQLIEDIMGWCRNVEHHWEKQVVLLTAVAGAGKSTVAHTVALIDALRRTSYSRAFSSGRDRLRGQANYSVP